jgi:hypothetical protein
MLNKGVLNRVIFLVLTFSLFIFSGGTAFSTQTSSNSCLDCHISIEKLKKITVELEKQKPKKSAEIAGEG